MQQSWAAYFFPKINLMVIPEFFIPYSILLCFIFKERKLFWQRHNSETCLSEFFKRIRNKNTVHLRKKKQTKAHFLLFSETMN